MRTLLMVFSYASIASAYKFLVFNPQYGKSHVNFLSRLSDALIDEGHEVVMVSPRTDLTVGSPKTKSRVLEVPQASKTAEFQRRMNSGGGGMATVWQTPDVFTQINAFYPMIASWKDQCEATLTNREVLELLNEEHFDGGFTEHWDSCGFAVLHLAGISKYAAINSLALIDGRFDLTQIPGSTAYVPTMQGSPAGDRMTFWQRLINTFVYLKMDRFLEHNNDMYQSMFDRVLSNPPNLREVMRNSSLVFMNSDPLADFPKLTSPRVIDIGGISVHAGHNPLDQYWSDVLSLRNHTVLMSFGTFVKSHLMPAEYKQTIRETARLFPHVTFIWYYEKPEHKVSDGISNIVETTWAPQHDLLHDPRLSAFITHGGQGSITEAAVAGVPLICIGVAADQLRNAHQVERNGVGIAMKKEDLGYVGPLEQSISRILTGTSFKANAMTLSAMIADRPFAMKDVFVRNMEFMVKYGPHTRFQHYGSQLSFIQYYLIDVFGFLALLGVSSLFVVFLSAKFIIALLSAYFATKKMKNS